MAHARAAIPRSPSAAEAARGGWCGGHSLRPRNSLRRADPAPRRSAGSSPPAPRTESRSSRGRRGAAGRCLAPSSPHGCRRAHGRQRGGGLPAPALGEEAVPPAGPGAQAVFRPGGRQHRLRHTDISEAGAEARGPRPLRRSGAGGGAERRRPLPLPVPGSPWPGGAEAPRRGGRRRARGPERGREPPSRSVRGGGRPRGGSRGPGAGLSPRLQRQRAGGPAGSGAQVRGG